MSRSNKTHAAPLTWARRGRLITGVVLGLLIVCPAARASIPPPVLAQRVVTRNFVIHYTTDSSTQDAISADTARLVGDNAEKSLATEASAFGFGPAEPDGHIDIYVYEFRAAAEEGFETTRSPSADQSEGYILIRASNASDLAVISHEVFHVLQDTVWVAGGRFLDEATAEWAQHRAFPDAGVATDLDPTVPLDCVDDTQCNSPGYQSWSFFEFLAERYGAQVVREIFEQAKNMRITGDPATSMAAIAATIVAHGGTLGSTFRDFALANVDGRYTLDELKGGFGGLSDAKTLRTGVKTARLRSRHLKVDHLAAAYLPVMSGSKGKRKHRCRQASLRLTISGPMTNASAGYVLGTRAPKPIALAGGHGHTSLRAWSTCSKSELTLALVNGSLIRDKARFTVRARLIVR